MIIAGDVLFIANGCVMEKTKRFVGKDLTSNPETKDRLPFCSRLVLV